MIKFKRIKCNILYLGRKKNQTKQPAKSGPHGIRMGDWSETNRKAIDMNAKKSFLYKLCISQE